jgi:hypothetical protein
MNLVNNTIFLLLSNIFKNVYYTKGNSHDFYPVPCLCLMRNIIIFFFFNFIIRFCLFIYTWAPAQAVKFTSRQSRQAMAAIKDVNITINCLNKLQVNAF